MRAKCRVLTATKEIPLKSDYKEMLDLWNNAVENGDPVIVGYKAAGGTTNYPEETQITIAVSHIIAIEEAR
jgi:hypothetical protein